MNIKDFKAGKWQKENKYRYFLPEKINHTFVWTDETINELLEKASLKLGELNSFTLSLAATGVRAGFSLPFIL